jgi:hypothetical protein
VNEFEMKELLYGEHPSTATGMFKKSLDEIKKKVFWEANSTVRRNRNLDPKQIITKTQTHKFPQGVTVRTHSMKKKVISAYFHGQVKQRSYGSGSNHSKLIVTFPMKGWNGEDYSYSFNGIMPKDMTFTEMGQILEYINSELKDMYGS